MLEFNLELFWKWHFISLVYKIVLLVLTWLLGVILKNVLKQNLYDEPLKTFFFSLFTGFIGLIIITAILLTTGRTVFTLTLLSSVVYFIIFKPKLSFKVNWAIEFISFKKGIFYICIVFIASQIYFGLQVYNPFNNIIGAFSHDFGFYANLGHYLSLYGIESFYLNSKILSLVPYNYANPYFVSLVVKTSELPSIVSLLLVVLPFLFGLIYIGALSIAEKYNSSLSIWYIGLFIFVCGGVGVGYQHFFISNTALGIFGNPKVAIIILILIMSFHHMAGFVILLLAHLIMAFYSTSSFPFFLVSLFVASINWPQQGFRSKNELIKIGVFHAIGFLSFVLFYKFFAADNELVRISPFAGLDWPSSKDLLLFTWRFLKIPLELALPLYLIYRSRLVDTYVKTKGMIIILISISLTLVISYIFVGLSINAIQFYSNFFQSLEILLVFFSICLWFNERNNKTKYVFILLLVFLTLRSITELSVYNNFKDGMRLAQFQSLYSAISEQNKIVFWNNLGGTYSDMSPFMFVPMRQLMLFKESLPDKVSVVLKRDSQDSSIIQTTPILWESDKRLSDEELILEYLEGNNVDVILVNSGEILPDYLKRVIKDSFMLSNHGRIYYLKSIRNK